MVKEKVYGIYLPVLSKDEVANIFTPDPSALVGKIIKVDLSRIAKGKLGEITCNIREVKEEKIFAELQKISLYPSYIKRFIRRGITKIDESFIVESKEKKKLRIKPVLITRKKVKRSVETALHKETRSFLTKLFASQNINEIFIDIIRGEIQKKLSKKLKKVYPLSFCEIREVLIVTKK